MDDREREQALLTALNTEHYVLQISREATITESVGRATVFLTLLSAALIGLGFVAGTERFVPPYLGAVLPTLVVTGLLTFARLVQNMVENALALRQLQRIRSHYHRTVASGHDFFADAVADEDIDRAAWRATGARPGWFQLLLTTAAMVGAVNALLIGVGATLLVGLLGVGSAAAIGVGVVVAVAAFAAQVGYIRRRSIARSS